MGSSLASWILRFSTDQMVSAKNIASKKLALVGYGKMGRLVEQLAPEHGFEVALRLDEADNRDSTGITTAALAGIDVAVEFSQPEAAPENLKRLAHAKIPAVVGTTGWLSQL